MQIQADSSIYFIHAYLLCTSWGALHPESEKAGLKLNIQKN